MNLLERAFCWLRRPQPDCWRRTVGSGLRSEGTKFGLSAFSLRGPWDLESSRAAPAFAAKWVEFLATEPEVRWVLDHHRSHVERIAVTGLDVLLARFSPQGELASFTSFLNARVPTRLEKGGREEVEQAILAAHRQTRHLPECSRPQALLGMVLQSLRRTGHLRGQGGAVALARRLLGACVLSEETVTSGSPNRFYPPDFRQRRGLGFGVINAVVRFIPGGCGADLWLQIHHAGADGAPVQEMLMRLEREWGCGAAIFPADSPKQAAFIVPCAASADERPVSLLVDFLDFGPLLRGRAELNRLVTGTSNVQVPFAAVWLWCLARQPEFAERRFAVAVDVPATTDLPRAVDLVAIRPEDYFNRPGGFWDYISDFQAVVIAGRERRSSSYAAMRSLAKVPPFLATRALAASPQRTRATFGTVGLLILKEAKVFVAPMADAAWDEGFIALGSHSLQAESGQVAAITVKGNSDQLRGYPAAFRRAIELGGKLSGELLSSSP